MKKFLGLFKSGANDPGDNTNESGTPKTPNTAQRNAMHAESRGKLNEQLSRKARHPSMIPGSFYDRETKFKASASDTKLKPRTEGYCQFKKSALGPKTPVWCKLHSHWLFLLPPSTPTNTAACELSALAMKKFDLVGSHLQAPPNKPSEFVLREADGNSMTFIVASPAERDQWMLAFSQVPGLFRRVTDFYMLGKKWGHGATCEVQEAKNRLTGEKLAVKSRLHRTRDATSAMHNELRILQMCAKNPHPAIPLLADYFFDEDGSVELVMELMEGGELFDWIASKKKFTEREAQTVFRQIVSGVAHLHSMGIAHRDLKPQNLMYLAPEGASGDSDGHIKIMDYDLAKANYSPEWEGRTPCGTIYFMAPEIVQRETYTLAIDMWSLGVILYILLCGHMPFSGKQDADVEEAILDGKYSLDDERWQGVSEEAKDLIKQLLQQDPEKRPTAAACLEHPWLASTASMGTTGAILEDGEEGAHSSLGLSQVLKSPEALREQLSNRNSSTRGSSGRLSTRDVLSIDLSPVRELSKELLSTKRSKTKTRAAAQGSPGLDLHKLRLEEGLKAVGNGSTSFVAGSSPLKGAGVIGGGKSPSTNNVADDTFADIGAEQVENYNSEDEDDD